MDIDDALADDVSPREFFGEHLPALFEARADRFERYSDVPIRFSVHLPDIDVRYSYELTSDGIRTTEGELIEFPILTIEGPSEQWETVRHHTRDLLERLDQKAEAHGTPPSRLNRSFLDDLERHDAVFEVDVETDDRSEPVSVRLILNDYLDPPRAKTIQLSASIDDLYDVVEGRRAPADAVRDAGMSGDLGLALDIGGLLLSHFPELEGE